MLECEIVKIVEKIQGVIAHNR